MLRTVTAIEAVCEKCGAAWMPRVREDGKLPAVCPECKSRLWHESGEILGAPENTETPSGESSVYSHRVKGLPETADRSAEFEGKDLLAGLKHVIGASCEELPMSDIGSEEDFVEQQLAEEEAYALDTAFQEPEIVPIDET